MQYQWLSLNKGPHSFDKEILEKEANLQTIPIFHDQFRAWAEYHEELSKPTRQRSVNDMLFLIDVSDHTEMAEWFLRLGDKSDDVRVRDMCKALAKFHEHVEESLVYTGGKGSQTLSAEHLRSRTEFDQGKAKGFRDGHGEGHEQGMDQRTV